MSDLEDNFGFDDDSSFLESETESGENEVSENEEPKILYPLKNSWTVYDHVKGDSENYGANTRKIGDINSVIEFWQFFNHYRTPSAIFNNGACKPTMGNKSISSISFFKKGILPEWEDPMNKKGAEVSKRRFKKHNPLAEVDANWFELLMACVGEQIDDSVTGIRVVDSSSLKKEEYRKDGQMDYKLMYRVELWFDDTSKKGVIEENFQNLLNLDPRNIHYKEHTPR